MIQIKKTFRYNNGNDRFVSEVKKMENETKEISVFDIVETKNTKRKNDDVVFRLHAVFKKPKYTDLHGKQLTETYERVKLKLNAKNDIVLITKMLKWIDDN